MEKSVSVSKDRLNNFFLDMTRRSFRELGIADAQVTRYVADVLTDFAHCDKLYRVRTRSGRRLESVVEMLAAVEDEPGESPLMRERQFRKYLGDYTLFMSGFFRSHVERGGFLDYYLREGRRSYWTVSELDLSLYVSHGLPAISGAFPEVRIFLRRTRLYAKGLFYTRRRT